MTTPASDVFDLFMSLISDYRLDSLYLSSGSSGLNTYLESWLLYSINDFDICNQSLEYSTATQEFSVDLNTENKLMLARIMKRYWANKILNDLLGMGLHLQDRDFKTHSENENIKEKRNLLNQITEEVSKALSDYGYKYNSWTNWYAGNFSRF